MDFLLSIYNTSFMPKHLSFEFLEEITQDFSKEQILGSGAYGVVYKGVLKDGEVIAVKNLYNTIGLMEHDQFQNELETLMRLHHPNIVRLIGSCYEERENYVMHNGRRVVAYEISRAICLEYLKNGNLEKYLKDESRILDWHTCYKIIKGICNGLYYLHEGEKTCTYHLDLKPANILLDEDMVPKIADFGLSKFFSESQSYTTNKVIGTFRYMPPEYIQANKITKKFDIYSLGVIIIEIMTGLKGRSTMADLTPEEFIESVHVRWRNRLQAAPSSYSPTEAYCQQVKKCIELALDCVKDDRRIRPSAKAIIRRLNETEVLIKGSRMDQLMTRYFYWLKSSFSSRRNPTSITDPKELYFSFEPSKQLISCSFQLENKYGYTAFKIRTTAPNKYKVKPDNGVVQPWRFVNVTITMQGQQVSPDMECQDKFLVESTTLKRSLTAEKITRKTFCGKDIVANRVIMAVVLATDGQKAKEPLKLKLGTDINDGEFDDNNDAEWQEVEERQLTTSTFTLYLHFWLLVLSLGLVGFILPSSRIFLLLFLCWSYGLTFYLYLVCVKVRDYAFVPPIPFPKMTTIPRHVHSCIRTWFYTAANYCIFTLFFSKS